MLIEFKKVTPYLVQDALEIGSRMRQEDRREALDLGGLSPSEAIQAAVKGSCAPGEVFIAYVDHEPEVIFGCVPSGACLGVAHIFLLGSDVISRLPIKFVRESMRYIKKWLQDHPILTNLVDARNDTHIKWLKFMGFRFIKKYSNVGPGRIDCLQFVMIAKELPARNAESMHDGSQDIIAKNALT